MSHENEVSASASYNMPKYSKALRDSFHQINPYHIGCIYKGVFEEHADKNLKRISAQEDAAESTALADYLFTAMKLQEEVTAKPKAKLLEEIPIKPKQAPGPFTTCTSPVPSSKAKDPAGKRKPESFFPKPPQSFEAAFIFQVAAAKHLPMELVLNGFTVNTREDEKYTEEVGTYSQTCRKYLHTFFQFFIIQEGDYAFTHLYFFNIMSINSNWK